MPTTRGNIIFPTRHITLTVSTQTPRQSSNFLGAFWHGCPKCFPNRQEPYRRHNDKCIDDVHRNTLDRLDRLRQLDYSIVAIWECAWEQQKRSDAQIAEFLEHHDVVAPLDPHYAFYGGRVNAAHLYYKTSADQKNPVYGLHES